MISQWRSWGEPGSSGFTCHYVRMQWVPNTNSTINTCTFTLWYVHWQDWTRICTPGFKCKNYCTSSDIGACPNTGKFTANPQSPNEMTHLLTPNSQKKYIDRSSSVMVAKYPKLYRYSQRIFSSNKAKSILRTAFVEKSDSWFMGGLLRFATLVCANLITLPHRRPMSAPKLPTSPPNVGNLSFTRLRRYISVQL